MPFVSARPRLLRSGLILLLLAVYGLPALAAEPSTPLVVGTKEAPPFAMKGAEGEWSGISIDLWQALAGRLEVDYELREYDLPGLLPPWSSARWMSPWRP